MAAGSELICPECGAHFYAPSAEELAFNSQGACKPVSYTHLDVYKRQEEEEARNIPVWKCILFMVIGGFMVVKGSDLAVSGASEIARYFGMSERFIGLTIVASVSYTHLDVYKRQVYRSVVVFRRFRPEKKWKNNWKRSLHERII